MPICETLKAMLQDKSLQEHFIKKHQPASSLLKDFMDGSAYLQNDFFYLNYKKDL